MAARAIRGKRTNRASIDRCRAVPAKFLSGHSQAIATMPKIKLRVCNIGTGLTEKSKFVVAKSQKNLGQKNPSRAAAI